MKKSEKSENEPPVMLTEYRFCEWQEDDVCVTLRNSGGSYGGVVSV